MNTTTSAVDGPPDFLGTSLDTDAVRHAVHQVEPDAVTRVLDRTDRLLDELGGRPGDPGRPEPGSGSAAAAWRDADEPIAAWHREVRTLSDASGSTRAELVARLTEQGVPDPGKAAQRVLSGVSVPRDADLVREVVESLNGEWVRGGFRALYDVARQGSGPPDRRPRRRVWDCTVSGLLGADLTDVDASRKRYEAQTQRLPCLHGRHRVLDALAEVLDRGAVEAQVLIGPSGYGKSTLALAVAERAKVRGTSAWWVPARDLDDLVSGLHAVAAALGTALQLLNDVMRDEPGERVQRLWRLLDAVELPWLIVLDDAGPDAVGDERWLHRSARGTVLVTTRFGDAAGWGARSDVHAVGPLDSVPGARLLLDRIGTQGRRTSRTMMVEAEEISRRLGGMPLALHNLGLFLGSGVGRQTLGEVVASLRRIGRPVDPLAAVRHIYEFCLVEVAAQGARTGRTVLRLLACFAPSEELPVSLLDERNFPLPNAGLARTWSDALDVLVRVGLVERLNGTSPSVRLHPVVAELARADAQFDRNSTLGIQQRAVGLLYREAERLDPGAPSNWARIRVLDRHAEELLANLTGEHVPLLAAAARLADRVAIGLVRAGNLAAAAALLDQVLRRTATLGDSHTARLAARRTQAWLIGLSGDLPRAERLLRGLAAAELAELGAGDPATLATRDALAWTMAEQGDLVHAAQQFSTLLADQVEMLGTDHPDTLATRHRLAWVTALTGGQQQAIDELETVLALRLQQLDADHLDVFNTRYRLAWVLTLRGRAPEAEQQYLELQADIENVLGPLHPLTLMVRSRQGWVLDWQSRLDESQLVFEQLLGDQLKVLGPDHRRTLRTRHGLACLLSHRGRLVEAEAAMRSVLADRERTLGREHHHTLDSKSYLAWVVLQQGRAAAAERLFRALLAERRRVMQPDHPVLFMNRHLLARALVRRGHLVAAAEYLDQLHTDQQGVLEPDSRLALDIRHTRAFVTGLQGGLRRCEQELRAVLDTRTDTLGATHRETLATSDYLVWVLGSANRLDEARAICSRLLRVRDEHYGALHPGTLNARYRMAWLQGLERRTEDAGQQLRMLLPDLVGALGGEHPDALRCRHALIWVLRIGDRLGEAESACRELIVDRQRVLGATAVDTLRSRDALGLILLGQRRAAEAEVLLANLHEQSERHLGRNHRDTMVVREHLLRTRAQRGHIAEARQGFADLRRDRAAFDAEHPDVRRAPRAEFLG